MSKIEINVQKISALTAQFTSLANSTDVVEQTVRGLKASVLQKVQARRNISARISQIANELRETEADIRKLSNFTQFAVEEYTQAEKKVRNSVERAANNGLIPRAPGRSKGDINDILNATMRSGGFANIFENLKKFVNDPASIAEWIRDGIAVHKALLFFPGLIAGGVQTAMSLSWMHRLRKLGYELGTDGKSFKLTKANLSPRMIKLLEITNKAIGKFDNLKVSGLIKSQVVGVLHMGKTTANIIPKALSGLFVDDINKYLNAIDKYKNDYNTNGSKILKATKDNAGNLLKGSWKFLRTNAITGAIASTGFAIYEGAGLIAANKIEWANDEAKLKYENRKVIRSGIVDVIGSAGLGAVGAVAGATLGALGGPAGMVIGGAIGGMAGNYLGGVLADGANKLIDKISSKLWDPHRDQNKPYFKEKVKEGTKGIIENAKGFFLKPFLG